MCGLVGVANKVAISDHTWLHIARDTLKHRGPDDSGEWWSKDQRVGLAHRRLSIFDLTSSGHQPMHLQERGLTIVFNGEIYNFIELRKQLQSLGHIFRSQSDTEVLLVAYAEWGYDCLNYLNGMFAFVLYDSKRKKIFIARDRAGEKPLFYHLNNGTLFFASELKSFNFLINPFSLFSLVFLENELKSFSLFNSCYKFLFFVFKSRLLSYEFGVINIWSLFISVIIFRL